MVGGSLPVTTAGSADEEYSEVQIIEDHLDDIGAPAVTCCYTCDQVLEDQIVAVKQIQIHQVYQCQGCGEYQGSLTVGIS